MERANREKLHDNLAQLQNLIKRDPSMYKSDFMVQLAHFDSELKIFKLKPEKATRSSALTLTLWHTVLLAIQKS